MQTNKALYDSGVYTNVQGLESLRHEYSKDASGVKKEVSQQFESLLVQALLKSMRQANKACSSGLLNNDQSEFYGDLLDKQLSLVISKSGIGLAKTIETYMDRVSPDGMVPEQGLNQFAHDSPGLMTSSTGAKMTPEPVKITQPPSVSGFDTAADFVKNLWGSAKEAAKLIGVDPKILLAQAALETSWGKKIVPQGDGKSTNNLFNIKAGNKWEKDSAAFNTIEERDGVLVKEKAHFRAYDSFKASFVDYTRFLQENSRYGEALKNAPNPEKFIHSLQKANYATDQRYSEKIMEIYDSKKFNRLIEENNLI